MAKKEANISKNTEKRVSLSFDNNQLVPLLFGEHNAHLHYIENMLNVDIATRGNELSIRGALQAVISAEDVLNFLWKKLQKNQDVSIAEVDAAIRFARDGDTVKKSANNGRNAFFDESVSIKTKKNTVITPRSPNQKLYMEAIRSHDLVFGTGPGGTGKTFLAVAVGALMYQEGLVERMIFCRPAVEAGERLGFLPGDMMEKIDPYLRPIYDALHDVMPSDQIAKKMASGDIEVAPLAFMRGRTLKNAFIVLDEAQNTTSMQMKMFLTRLGEGARMVVTGDPSQTDLLPGTRSGLKEAMEILNGMVGVAFANFTKSDVVRHKLVGKIIEAYESHKDHGPGH